MNPPHIGKDIGAVPVLKELVDNGHQLILFTMRCDLLYNFSEEVKWFEYLDDAINWFKGHDIPFYGVQKNPTQHTWTSSPKVYGHLYIDDAALGCPLIYPKKGRSYVNWVKIRDILIRDKVIQG